MPELPNLFFLEFAPERWTTLHKLAGFAGPPLPNNAYVRIGLRDCGQHLDKTALFFGIAERLRPNLALDREELDRIGATSNLNSQDFAALGESIICTLYSALDGLRGFLYGTYRDVKCIQNGSNEQLFKRAKAGKYGHGFPEEIRALLAAAYDSWFPSFREFRTELTHGSTGTCHLDVKTQRIRYLNDGIKREGRTFVLEDFEHMLRQTDQNIRSLVDAVAAFHFATLEPTLKFVICGVYRSHLYYRLVAPSATVSSNDGHCLSYDWFEKKEGYYCPRAKKCGAYGRKWPGGSAEFLANPKTTP
jgi:hypothetical protein